MAAHHGKVFWSELNTRDFEGAKKFYSAVLGWTYSHMDGTEDSYAIAHAGEGPPVAGIGDMDKMQLDPNLPPHWFTYIAVKDIKSAVDKINANGGHLIKEIFAIDGIGQIAIVMDPTGAAIGYIQPVEEVSG